MATSVAISVFFLAKAVNSGCEQSIASEASVATEVCADMGRPAKLAREHQNP